jgi:hypothetical protein
MSKNIDFNFNLLKEVLSLRKLKQSNGSTLSYVSIKETFVIKDGNHASILIKGLETLLLDIARVSNNGYINDPGFNLPVVIILIKALSITTNLEKFNASILLNTLFYNTILLNLIKLSKMIEAYNNENNCLHEDELIDLTKIVRSLLTMLHPSISNRIKKRGITILLSSVAGFDCEYEIDSSLDMSNRLLSTQISSNSTMYIKVPIVNRKPFNQSCLAIDSIEDKNI